MDQTRITQCPKCDTTFRITPSQLQVAKGAVRCGSCLHVFRASDHFQSAAPIVPIQQDDRTHDMFKDSAPETSHMDQPTETKPQSASQDSLNSDTVLDDLFASSSDVLDPSKEAALPSDNKSPAQSNDQLLTSSLDTQFEHSSSVLSTAIGLSLGDELIEDTNGLLTDQPTSLNTNNPSQASKQQIEDDEFGLIHDDSALINDDNGLINDDGYLHKQSKAPEFNEEFLTLNHQDSVDPFSNDGDKFQETIENTHDNDEAWAHALLADNDDAETAPSKEAEKPSVAPPKASNLNTMQSAFSYIEVDPLELSLPKQALKRQAFIWFTASLLLIIVFLIQSAYFNFNQWARMDSYRPFYQVACEYLKCTVPSSYDLARIRTTASPQVSSHPRFKNALVVDVLFINGAQYAQAFPQLSLTFSDKENKVMAHRVFQPHEYLAGEAAGLTMMPSQTPIHIALEIADPGPSANNYQVHFIQP